MITLFIAILLFEIGIFNRWLLKRFGSTNINEALPRMTAEDFFEARTRAGRILLLFQICSILSCMKLGGFFGG